jgi:hypothetical protein
MIPTERAPRGAFADIDAAQPYGRANEVVNGFR